MEEIRFISATGALGAGVDDGSLEEAMTHEPHFIAADAGTTDQFSDRRRLAQSRLD